MFCSLNYFSWFVCIDYCFIFKLNSIQEEEQVALPHDVSSKLPLTTEKNGSQVSYIFSHNNYFSKYIMFKFILV